LSHAPPCELPVQLVDAEANPSAGHVPFVPLQVSATSHWPAEARHVVPLDLKTSTHVLAVPEQWSPASLSHAPPCELPVQPVDDDANASFGHVPFVPLQTSATSHWPAEERHVVPLVLKASTQVFAVPEQWSPASLSHSPPCELPVQPVDDDANASFGQVALVPVHFSATSHWPAEARHVTVLATKPQLTVQQDVLDPFAAPRSHDSPASTIPLPQRYLYVAMSAAQLSVGEPVVLIVAVAAYAPVAATI